jgi:UDP-N-acetylglucosamine-lysosomal-enzyme
MFIIQYCDRACQVKECGYDAGDCGVDVIFQNLFGVDLSENITMIEVPDMTSAMYLNLTTIVGEGVITDGSHDNADLIRTATISQKHKVMTLTFHR